VTVSLALALGGLAVIDAVNLATIWVVVIILLAAQRPAATGWTFAFGAIGTFLAGTLLVYFGASYAGDLVADLALWMRRIVFSASAVTLVVMGIRRLKARERHGIELPAWVNPWSGLPLGVAATISDLPNAFPMFFAVERLIEADVDQPVATLALIGYTAVYALPTLFILVVGLAYKDRVRAQLQRLYDRFAVGPARASWKLALLYWAGAAACVAVLVFVIG
jgi:hypothetical protein